MPDDPNPRRSTLRRVGLVVVGLVLATGLAVIVFHTPPVRRLVLRFVAAEAQRRYGIRIEASRLDYDLLALSVGLRQLRVAADRSPDLPFFEAEYAGASIRLRAFPAIAFNDITITNGHVRVVVDRDGRSNLPEPQPSAGGEPPALEIAHAYAPQLVIEVKDARRDLALAVPSLTLDIRPQSGRISLDAPATLSMAAHSTRISTLDGGAAFDGRSVKLSAVQLNMDEGSARLDGAVSLLVRDPSIDLRVTGTADVERLARWAIDGGELPRGAIAFDAHATGALNGPVTDLQVRSSRLTWAIGPGRARAGGSTSNVVVADLSATSRVTTTRAEIQQLQFGLAGGTIAGTGTLPFDDSAATVSASWRDVNATELTNTLAGGLAVSPSGSLSGSVDLAGPLARMSGWSADVRLRIAGGVTRRGVVAIPGDSLLRLADGRWRLEARHRAGEVLPLSVIAGGQLDEAAIANSTIAGRAEVLETSVPALIRLLRTVGVAQPPPDAVTTGTLSASVMLDGRLSNPEVAARAEGRGLTGGQLSVPAVDAMVSGQPLQPRLSFSVMAPDAVVAGQPLRDVRGAGSLSGDAVAVDIVSAMQGDGRGDLSGAGRFNLRTQQYDVTLDANGWTVLANDNQPLAGEVDAMFRGAGSVSAPGGNGTLRITNATWGGASLGDLAADLELAGQAANIMGRAMDFNAALTARVGVRAPYPATGELRVDAVDLERLTRSAPLPVPFTGQASLVAHADGSIQMWRDATATVDVTSLESKAGDLPIRLADPARIRYEQQRVHVERFELDAGATRLSVSGDLSAFERSPGTSGPAPAPPSTEAIIATASGDIGEAARAVSATGLAEVPITEGSGPIALLARVTGSLERPVVAADLEVGPGSVTVNNQWTASNVTLRARLEHDVLDLREAHASYEGARLEAVGSVPISFFTSTSAPGAATGPASLHATATGISPAVFRGFVDTTTLVELGGAVDANLNLEAPSLDLARLTGDLTFPRLELELGGLAITQRTPTRIVAQGGFARIETWNWAGPGATLGVSGQIRLADRQAAILANADIDLRVVTPFVRSAGIATAGRLTPRISLTGPIASPRIDGDVALADGEVRVVDPRIVVNDLTARAVLTRTTATLATLTGSINGGSLTGEGAVEYQPDTGVTARLATDIREMALEFPPGLRSQLNAMLQLQVAPVPGQIAPAGRLSGTVTVLRGAYRDPIAVVGGFLASARARRTGAAFGQGPGSEPSLLNQLALDIHLQTDEDLIVDNNVARIELGADVNIIGTVAAPGMSGRAVLRENGRLYIGRNVYSIKPGTLNTIDFVSPDAIEPQLNLLLTTRVRNEDIDLTLTGPAEAPQVAMSSTSGLGQADITSLLLTGRTLDQLSSADAAFIGTQVIGNFSGEALGFAARAVGLDTLRFGGVEGAVSRGDPLAVATEVNPISRLTFGQNIGPNLSITFSQSLLDSSAQTWIVDYMPLRRLDMSLVSDDADLLSFQFRHDVAFGGGVTTAQPSASPPREEPRVSEVNLTGQLAFPEERIRGVLRVRQGDRFDFARWQEDRDRVEDFYHRNGRLAAHVNATRAASTGTVALAYAIDAGPETAIAVSGADLDRATLQRLSDAWAASIFDEFLVDEATQIVRARLAEQGYLQPMVTALVTTDAGRQTLQIDVQPGVRSGGTIIRLLGPDEALIKDLEARIAEARLVEQVIGDPGAVERNLTEYLRSRGYLRAMVSTGPPAVEGRSTVVPITIDPGPEFLLGTVAYEGRQFIPANEVADTVALMPGTPFDPALIDAARVRLLALYRRSGFVSVTVAAQTVVRPSEPVADVTFAIDEGVRQTIGNIVVAGNSGVNTDVVTRALRLTPGSPLEPEELVRARTRVFSTGLFRRVDVATEMMNGPAAGGVQPMRVRVTVEPWPALRLRYGFQVAEERPESDPSGHQFSPGFLVDVVRQTVFGRALSLEGVAQYQRLQNSLRALMNAPMLMSWPIQSSLVAQREHAESTLSKFVTNKNSVSWQQQYLTNHLTLSYAYAFEENHTFDTAPVGSGFDFDVRIRVARLIGNAARDTRSDPFNPINGSLFAGSVEWAPEGLGSQLWFLKWIGQAYRFQSVRRVVLASAARVGFVRPLGGQQLIVSEHFFTGGSRTVRGVEDDSLGPLEFGLPAGGEALLVLNQEVRVPIYKWLGGVAFIDGGNVFPTASAIRFSDLTGSVGVGVRLATPFALLRADYGKVVWTGTATRFSRWSFGIGQAF